MRARARVSPDTPISLTPSIWAAFSFVGKALAGSAWIKPKRNRSGGTGEAKGHIPQYQPTEILNMGKNDSFLDNLVKLSIIVRNVGPTLLRIFASEGN